MVIIILSVSVKITPNSTIAATKNKQLIMSDLIIDKATNTVTYGNKKYRVQNDRGHLHIVIRENGRRNKITVKHKKEYEYNVFFHYYLEGLSITHPCKVQDWWLEMSHQKRYIPYHKFIAA